MLNKLDRFHKTKLGYLAYGLVELGAAYLAVGLALDQGNILWYVLALIFLVGALQNIFKLIGKLIRGNGETKRTR
jgi:hypothetical protein